jgi:hypothetical protein
MLGEYRMRWKGARTFTTQALDFPRTLLPLADQPILAGGFSSRYDGYGGFGDGAVAYYDNNVIPIEIKKAQALLALRAFASGGVLVPDLEQQEKSVKIGPLAVEFDNTTSRLTTYTAPARMLTPFLINNGQARLIRR